MIDKDSCNPQRSVFVEELIRDIRNIEDYKRFNVTRENVGVIVTYIIQRLGKTYEAEGIEVIEEILTYRQNEKNHYL